jgi:peptidoglycan/xylan/chitin deacetylase (PgdA/CDA1 family)
MLEDLFKTTVKKTIPAIIDKTGYYDHTIHNNDKKLIVPMYHRIITDSKKDPFKLGMCIKSETFEKQLSYFKSNFNSIRLKDYQHNTIDYNDKPNISITFDDGYKDNIEIAMPLLMKYKLDSTFFICCSILTNDKEFWWDIIINAFSDTSVKVVDLLSSPVNLKLKPFKLNILNKKKHCQTILNELWKISDIDAIYDTAYYIEDKLLGYRNKIPKINEHDIQELYKNGFEIAAHSLTHPNMNIISSDQQALELKRSKNILEDIIGDNIDGFAYPAGHENEQLIHQVKASGYKYAVGTRKGVNRNYNPFSIERFGVAESSVSDMKRSIYNYCKL